MHNPLDRDAGVLPDELDAQLLQEHAEVKHSKEAARRLRVAQQQAALQNTTDTR